MTRLAHVADAGVPFEPPAKVAVATRIGVVAIAALVVGATGSRGIPLPASTDVYDDTVATIADAPAWVGHGFEVVSELGLVVLAGALLLAAWRHRRHAVLLARTVAGGCGVVLAYATSEALKMATAQPRPCLGLAPGDTVADCPPATDWSLPSNHATIAMALAVALIFTSARAARWAIPLALTVAASRVIIGVHYPHDVTSGLLLAATVVTATVLVLERPVGVLVTRWNLRLRSTAERAEFEQGPC